MRFVVRQFAYRTSIEGDMDKLWIRLANTIEDVKGR